MYQLFLAIQENQVNRCDQAIQEYLEYQLFQERQVYQLFLAIQEYLLFQAYR